MRYSIFAGLGDQTLWLSLLHNVRGHKTLVCPPGRAEIVKLFPGSWDELVESTDRTNTFPLWHGAHVGDELAFLAKLGGVGSNRTMADVVRYCLGLRSDASMSAPVWRAYYHRAAARERMDRLGLPVGRTALVSPYSHTTRARLSEGWWSAVVAELKARGFTVATNVANRGRAYDRSRHGEEVPALSGTVAADVPLSEIGPFAECCGTVIAHESGLPYLLSRVLTRLCVIWEQPPDSAWFRGWSVSRVFNVEHVVELHPKVGEPFDPAILPDWRPHEAQRRLPPAPE